MEYELIRLECEDGIGTIFLNRPEKLNALNASMHAELIEVVHTLSRSEKVKVLILTGSTERAFSAGADLSEFGARLPADQREAMSQLRAYEVLAECPLPTIAAVRGFCLGGGAELALACDLRVADRSAIFGQPEIRLGLIPGGGATQRLTRLVGSGQALRLTLTGDGVDAEEAFRIGLIEFLVDEGRCLEKAREIADRMGRWSSTSLRLAKDAVRAASETPLSAGLKQERELFLEAFASEDAQEGIRQFVRERAESQSNENGSLTGLDEGKNPDG